MGSLNIPTDMKTIAGVSLCLVLGLVSAQEQDPVEALAEVIPGQPGEDYPIFAFAPDTSFLCDGQVQGYYADPEADCQSFHICANLGDGGLTKYSLLCPNGTLFNQQYFICDWWFNVDCSLSESFYSLNEDIAAEQAANNPDGVEGIGIGAGGDIDPLATSYLPSYPSSPPNQSGNLGIQPRRKNNKGRK